VTINDFIPCGLKYLSTNNTEWTHDSALNVATTTYDEVINPGSFGVVEIMLEVQKCFVGNEMAWTNVAEIESANDINGNPRIDVDSSPDNDPNNDTIVDDEIKDEKDEDDHDPAIIDVYDIALKKESKFRGADSIGLFVAGDIVEFYITIINQGNVDAYDVVITDYLNTGYVFNAALNPGWTLTGGLLHTKIAGPFVPGAQKVMILNLEVQALVTSKIDYWYNEAEISGGNNADGVSQVDADSTPDTDPDNDNDLNDGSDEDTVFNIGDNNDNIIDEDINNPLGNNDDDEDDNDAAEVIIEAKIGNRVWKDYDYDGIQDDGEPGVAGVIVNLYDCDGDFIRSVTTDADGYYLFDFLRPGGYQLNFDISNLPSSYEFTLQNQGINDELDSDVNDAGFTECIVLQNGEINFSIDAGLITAAIGDYVWHDLNGDGQQGIGEQGISGVQVNLYKGDGSYSGSTTTDVNGYYLFDFLYPGDYYLEFIDPSGFERTFYNKGNDLTDNDLDGGNGPRTTTTTYLARGERDMTWDAGYYRCIPIGDLVWYDINKNDVWETNENGINGLRVNLWRNHFGTWLIWDHTYTGNKPNTPSDEGYWKFCAPPGEYYVEVIMPPLGLVRARANVGTVEENDSDITNANGPTTTDKFTVLSGQEKCDLGAGFYPQATAGNLVWVDANGNGVQETQEARMSGVLVEAVLLASQEVVQSAVTDTDGTYMIEGLEKQQYYLKFTPPAGYIATAPRAAADHMDSDVDGSYGPNTTRAFDMQPASAYENIDMGLSFAPLPVEWLDVTARRVNNTHIIEWRVARESNVSHYELERRFGSEKAFYTIPGKVLAKGNTNEVTGYNLSDLDVDKSGIYVYRVKQYDFDGKSSYSKLVKVSHNGENSIELYPNPAKNETNVQIVVTQDAVVSVEMFDAASKLVKVIQVSDVQIAGDMIYNTNLQDVPAGVYNVVITIDGVQTQKKLIRIE
jgi:uncharacterized repeat protein (TIGR01451 family)